MRKIKLKNSLYFTVFIITSFLLIQPAWPALTISNPRALGLGGAYIGLADGIEAPYWNPANLAMREKQLFSMNFMSLGLGVNNNSFSKHQYDIYNGAYLTNQDLEDILACIPADGWDLDFQAGSEILGFAYGNYAFTITAFGAGKATIAKDLPSLIKGNEIGKTYDMSNCEMNAWGFISYGVSAALPLEIDRFERFALGGTIKYLQGISAAEIVRFNGNLKTDDNYIYAQANGTAQYARGGNGISIDLGAAARINKKWSAGITFSDLLNTISWSKKAEMMEFSVAPDSVNLYELTEADDADSIFQIEDTTKSIQSFSTTLPQQMRIGAVYYHTNYLITMDYIQGFRSGPAVTTTPQLAGGIEFRPVLWLPLRAGIAVGGKEGIMVALGLGFHIGRVRIDFAATSQGSVLPQNRQGSTLAVGIRLLP